MPRANTLAYYENLKLTATGANVMNFIWPYFTNFHYRLECLSLASLSSLVHCLWARPGAYPTVEHLKGGSLRKTQALSTIIRLGRKGLPRTNTLAYYENSKLMAAKSFITKAPGANVMNFLLPYFTNFHDKLECLSMASLSSLVCCLWARPGAYPTVEQIKGGSLR